VNSGWRKMWSAPVHPMTGRRGPIILGCDAEGNISKMFFVPEDPRGSGWIMFGTGEGLMQWEPVAWYPLPDLANLLD
jgi:hypothetical protein